METELVVNEIFGPTVQGEGRSMGRRCAFLRLGGCNLSCTWCDTPYTWDWTGAGDSGVAYDPRKELHRRSVREVAEELLAFGVGLIVISGGEPLGQQNRLIPLVELLTARGLEIEIETNGTHAPDPALVAAKVRFNVSPKLAHSGDSVERRIVPSALRSLAVTEGTTFKFVCRNTDDLDEVGALVEEFTLGSVWIMPKGQTGAEISRHMAGLADAVIARGWNLTTRLHTLLWGDTRGV
ncbi:7-carboxy-7-deazaguanine synthase QueE [Streptomyces pluripotens]|uniref:7-carboxy-7-deazaguanine synthase n=1 Tax=Streptomyces pluripotens TaxID=1355015 RepID=A0A221P7H7_9ACTN|nr:MULTISPECIES: 7-carboxy-7-deazaguanine synthase QueE [Streptomyces]ARP73799.1 7-carboxy-7-deazaguanine synthase QueE [Streptomyces pluripotens]ASN28046.1 7-carboxy-7-deazaguanine synthase QueE [Streptomyces pluripotens]KIE27946.1 radical SAM protein [Streptomyces sp. MUSC 125]MCH0559388.1 7-carboxy-7-deazaguanine synthase QueE [Streptomyces sp. MUM 16J]